MTHDHVADVLTGGVGQYKRLGLWSQSTKTSATRKRPLCCATPSG
eukprot:CAMPEP_0113987524 /NCGR_PEP_ID=MMETSP0328-20130328/7031_1 /TAXON_ID=39455 /ORGANISM="Alexandrium minutum" /LENGTH=44 /assembly_acc=CAM_ASM_000350